MSSKSLVAVCALASILLGGCPLAIPNGLFACGQPADCPSGFFCWNTDNRCYDAEEPQCQPDPCEEVLADFAGLGFDIECGSLPDGCDGTIECGGCEEGTACGANGQNFVCSCDEYSCASFGGGAQCGAVPTRCDGSSATIDCGSCFGDYECVDNRCVCPTGTDCDTGCPGGEPTYPCSRNECSPSEGLPDGCGGVAYCPPCGEGEGCTQGDDDLYRCLGECTCEAAGVQCGSATICGAPTLCGSCDDNGFPGHRCESGTCVCDDELESNDSPSEAAAICTEDAGARCLQDAWSVEVEPTLGSASDIDFFRIDTTNESTMLTAEADDGGNDRWLYLAYLCPDDSSGILLCSELTETIGGIEFCKSGSDEVGLVRDCGSAALSERGTVLAGVAPRGTFAGSCDRYRLRVRATYQSELPEPED